jgi:glycopeptide antibiotics resistance protein
MKKILSGSLFALYLVTLLWLVLFKLRVNISSVFNDHHRSLNLIPFAAPSMVHGEIGYGEMIYNCLFFIPFGLLLSVNFKKPGFLKKLAIIMVFSVTVELIQFIFAIGATDITDVITNTLGGFIGLTLYALCNKYINSEKLDRVINVIGAVLFVLFMLARSRITLRQRFPTTGYINYIFSDFSSCSLHLWRLHKVHPDLIS